MAPRTSGTNRLSVISETPTSTKGIYRAAIAIEISAAARPATCHAINPVSPTVTVESTTAWTRRGSVQLVCGTPNSR